MCFKARPFIWRCEVDFLKEYLSVLKNHESVLKWSVQVKSYSILIK